jgi:beta-lactamase class D
MIKKLCTLGILLAVVASSCRNIRIKEYDEWGKYFEEAGVQGCFEVYDNNKETAVYYNKERCAERFTPASTFKIFSALVALESSIAPDEQLLIKWDGKTRYYKDGKPVYGADTAQATLREEWAKDLTMAQAFKVSAVPYFQELARRIGAAEMQSYLDTVKYGNMSIGEQIDEFWLNGSLKISPDEQVGFVKRLYFGELPGFSERTQRIVRGMMLQKETDTYKLYYKTGWGKSSDKNILWVVGFVEKINELKNVETKNIDRIPHPYFFALNFETDNSRQDVAELRLSLLNKLLAAYGLDE